jgi:membrane-bound metal-dependent hydrolase YbcI (DUF457 family)
MFLAHFAAGLAARRLEPRLPLGTALLAAQLPDALWPLFLLAGLERVTIAPGETAVTPLRFDHYPWSHSLLMVAVWGAVWALAYAASGRPRRAALWLAVLAVSHWALDALSHEPDMPLLPTGGPRVGLGLWQSLPLTLVVEGSLFAGAVFIYMRGRRLGPGFWGLMALLVAIYAASLLGPPPPSANAIALTMLPLLPLLWWWGNKLS